MLVRWYGTSLYALTESIAPLGSISPKHILIVPSNPNTIDWGAGLTQARLTVHP